MAARQLQQKSSSLTDFARCRQCTLVSAGDFVGDGQSQPGARLPTGRSRPRPIFLHAVEAFKEMGQMLGRDARPGIGDGDLDVTCALLTLNGNLAAFWRIFDGVVQQVQEEAQE